MTTLTDRYVWAVLRAVPQRQRDELEPEIRALVADAAEAHAGHAAPDAAERAALVELGDPDALAARYTDATRFLIGPRLYPEWERLLRLLLPIVVPIAGIAFGAVGWATGKPVGEAIVSGLGVAFTVAVQLTFWFTLVFAIAERTGAAVMPATGSPWTPDQLPELPAPDRLSLGEAVASVAFGAVRPRRRSSGCRSASRSRSTAPPTRCSIPRPVVVAVVRPRADASRRSCSRSRSTCAGRWTWAFAIVNAILAAALAIPAVYLIQEDLLLNDELVAAIDAQTGGNWFSATMGITVFVFVLDRGRSTRSTGSARRGAPRARTPRAPPDDRSTRAAKDERRPGRLRAHDVGRTQNCVPWATIVPRALPSEPERRGPRPRQAAQHGDREAFAILARTHGDRLYAIAQRILRDAGLAEDALQQALISAWRELPEPP